MATAAEKQAKADRAQAEKSSIVQGQQRLSTEVTKAAAAFPARRLRSSGDLSRYAIGGFIDDPYASQYFAEPVANGGSDVNNPPPPPPPPVKQRTPVRVAPKPVPPPSTVSYQRRAAANAVKPGSGGGPQRQMAPAAAPRPAVAPNTTLRAVQQKGSPNPAQPTAPKPPTKPPANFAKPAPAKPPAKPPANFAKPAAAAPAKVAPRTAARAVAAKITKR